MVQTAHVASQTEVSYQIIASLCKTHGCEGETVYGLQAQYREAHCFVEISDISCHKRDVEKLMERLVSEDSVFPDQLPYIIDDYLTELYS